MVFRFSSVLYSFLTMNLGLQRRPGKSIAEVWFSVEVLQSYADVSPILTTGLQTPRTTGVFRFCRTCRF